MKLRVLYHLAFWGFFIFLFWQQNPNATTQEYLAWFIVLGVAGLVVYINLFLLFPKYFFRKKYIIYSLFLFVTISSGTFTLRLLFPSGNSSFSLPISQHFVNLFFIVVITSSFKLFREYSRKQELLIRAENEQLKTKLNLLKSQVNPHFLFNTLNTINTVIIAIVIIKCY